MTHYNHEYTDEFLHSQEEIARKNAICLFAKEGMEISQTIKSLPYEKFSIFATISSSASQSKA